MSLTVCLVNCIVSTLYMTDCRIQIHPSSPTLSVLSLSILPDHLRILAIYFPVPLATLSTQYISASIHLISHMLSYQVLSLRNEPSRTPLLERLHITRAISHPSDIPAKEITRSALRLSHCP